MSSVMCVFDLYVGRIFRFFYLLQLRRFFEFRLVRLSKWHSLSAHVRMLH